MNYMTVPECPQCPVVWTREEIENGKCNDCGYTYPNAPQTKTELKLPTCCGVPRKFHATCCGWINASYILNPETQEDKAAMWDRMQAILALPNSPMKDALMQTLPTANVSTVTLKN